MPTETPDLSGLTTFLQERGLPLLIVLILTLVAFRAMRPLAHRFITHALEQREHAEAARDADPEVAKLMAEESVKRVTTIEDLVATILKVPGRDGGAPGRPDHLRSVARHRRAGADRVRDHAGRSEHRARLSDGHPHRPRGSVLQGRLVSQFGLPSKARSKEVGMRRTVIRDGSGTVHSVRTARPASPRT